MSTHRIAPRERFEQPKERGPNGRRLCRYCKQEVPPRKQSWCSKECVEAYWIATNPGYVRRKVWLRDQGVCAGCGLDTKALQQQLNELARHTYNVPRDQRMEADCVLRGRRDELYAKGFNHSGPLWEADHIVPVVEGGGECGLDGYRTLCVPCHKSVTRSLRRRLANPDSVNQLSMDGVA